MYYSKAFHRVIKVVVGVIFKMQYRHISSATF